MADAAIANGRRPADEASEPTESYDSRQSSDQSPCARRALVVLGPHRSGTSALTRVLSLSGAALPSHILPAEDGLPNDGNTQAGFWESKTLMLLHEEALSSAGSKWDDPFDLPPSWFHSEVAEAFTSRLVEALEEEFGDAPLFVAKDPRISRLAPIWNAALRQLGVQANWVIAVRSPLDVAASLNYRDGFSQPKGLLFWLTDFLAAERHTRHQERFFVLYDDLLIDWRGVITQIGDRFGITFSRRSYLAGAEVDDFLDLGLRHHATMANEVAVREDVGAWVKETFQWAIRAAAGKPESSELLDDIHRSLRQAESVYGPLLASAEYESHKSREQQTLLAREAEDLRETIGDYNRRIAQLSNDLNHLHANLASREEEIARADAELAEMRQLAEQRQEEAARAQRELLKADAELAEMRQLAEQRQEEAVRAQYGFANADAELAEMRQLAEQRQTEITMLRIEANERIERLRAETNLSLHITAEREGQLERGLKHLSDKVRSISKRLEEKSVHYIDSAFRLRDSARGTTSSRVKTIAFFLPQYHPIPENDRWWGRGFTEWTNVTRAKPCFRGHQQPLLPSELGFYDLRLSEVRAQQAALAGEHGIHGFCYYYYWFNGKKVLHRPLEEVLASGEPDFPFCLCWANENWTRRWDGEDQEILIAQEHSPESDARFLEEILPALRDPRYITRNGEPLLLVYRADLLADPLATTAIWRESARRAGLPGLHLCAVWQVEDPIAIGFDALVEFPPHHFLHDRITDQVEVGDEDFEGEVFDYAAGVEAIEPLQDQGYPVYRGVMSGWDNTPRRGKRAWIFTNSTPECYGRWLEKVVRESAARPGQDDQFVFINAWNEWAEGATLEPSRRHGRAYLEATRTALQVAIDPMGRLSRLEQQIDDRLEDVNGDVAKFHELVTDLHDTTTGVATALQRQQSELEILRDLSAERRQSEERARRRELVLRCNDGLQRLALARQADPPSRDLWLSPHYGVVGLVLKLPFWLLSFHLRSRWNWWRQARRILRSGLFDPDYYRRLYPEVEGSKIDPLYHYVRYGAAEGRDPNPFLSGGRYLARYPELAASGDIPLLHYLTHGDLDTDLVDHGTAGRGGSDETTAPESAAISECREPSAEPAVESVPPGAPRVVQWDLNQDQLAKRHKATTTLLLVSHDAARAGAQIYLLEVLKSFARFTEYELYLLLRSGGELRADFERYAHVFEIQEHTASGESEEAIVAEAVHAIGKPPGVALCNTVASGAVAKILDRLDVPVISIVHELPTTVESLGEQTIYDTVGSSKAVVVVSEFVKNALVERYNIPDDLLTVLYVGVTKWQPEVEVREPARQKIFERYGFPDDAVLILGCGSIHHRKGTDLFVQVARDAILHHGLDRAYFLWVGGDELSPLFRSWCEHDIATSGLQDRILFAGQQDSTVDYYLAANVFLLTSREDPFPLVNLEAMARGLPVIAFSGAGGAAEALADDAGIVVPYLDTAEMARALVRLVEAPRYHAAISQQALSRAQEHYRWDRFIGELRELLTRHLAHQPESLAETGPSIT